MGVVDNDTDPAGPLDPLMVTQVSHVTGGGLASISGNRILYTSFGDNAAMMNCSEAKATIGSPAISVAPESSGTQDQALKILSGPVVLMMMTATTLVTGIVLSWYWWPRVWLAYEHVMATTTVRTYQWASIAGGVGNIVLCWLLRHVTRWICSPPLPVRLCGS